MKFYTTYILIFLTLTMLHQHSVAQDISIQYQAQLKDLDFQRYDDSPTMLRMRRILHARTKSALPAVKFKVIANHETYHVFYEPIMTNDSSTRLDINQGISKSIDGEEIYGNLKKDTSYYIPRSLAFIRKVPLRNVNWRITKEVKYILGFKCYKAIAELKNEKLEYQNLVPLKAWFSPALNFSAGPTAYAFLPGAILELELPEVVFKAIDVKEGDYRIEPLDLRKLPVKNHLDFVQYYKDWNKKNLSGLN